MRSTSVTINMFCPECESLVEDIEGQFTSCHGTENFWGAQVSTDDSEFEVVNIPDCEECGKVTIDADDVNEHFWQNEYHDLGGW